MKKRILFICIHNSARSQMAEAFCHHYGNEAFTAESAGLEPGSLNQNVIKVMQEIGIDVSRNQCNSVFDFFREGRSYSYVITVCDKEAAERCPIFPGLVIDGRLHWSFSDPSQFTGSQDEILQQTRQLRDKIKEKVLEFLENN